MHCPIPPWKEKFINFPEQPLLKHPPSGQGTPLPIRGGSKGGGAESPTTCPMNAYSYMPQFSHIMDIEVASNSNSFFLQYLCFMAKYSRLLSRYSLFNVHNDVIFVILRCIDVWDSMGPVYTARIYGRHFGHPYIRAVFTARIRVVCTGL